MKGASAEALAGVSGVGRCGSAESLVWAGSGWLGEACLPSGIANGRLGEASLPSAGEHEGVGVRIVGLLTADLLTEESADMDYLPGETVAGE